MDMEYGMRISELKWNMEMEYGKYVMPIPELRWKWNMEMEYGKWNAYSRMGMKMENGNGIWNMSENGMEGF